MKQELKYKEGIRVQSWINNTPISTNEWDVFADEQNDSEYVILVKDKKTGNNLRIVITKYEKFKEDNKSTNEVPES